MVSRYFAVIDFLHAVLIWDEAPLTRTMMTIPILDGTVLPGEKQLMDLLHAVLIWDGAPLTRTMMIPDRRALPGEKQSPSPRTMPIPDGTVLPGEKQLMTILGHPHRLLQDSLHFV